jgi:hypothetical protein
MAKPFPKLKGPIGAASVQTPGEERFTLRVPLRPTLNANPVLTGVRIPAKTAVTSVYVDMASSASSADPRLDVGITTSTQGFITGASVTTAGLRRASAASGSITLGVLMLDANGVAPCPSEFITNSPVEITYSTRAAATQLNGMILLSCKTLSG